MKSRLRNLNSKKRLKKKVRIITLITLRKLTKYNMNRRSALPLTFQQQVQIKIRLLLKKEKLQRNLH